jgi:hypothetical protein
MMVHCGRRMWLLRFVLLCRSWVWLLCLVLLEEAVDSLHHHACWLIIVCYNDKPP